MDQVAESIANADREAALGDYRAMASLFCYVCMRLWARSRLLEQTVDRLERELGKIREPW